MIACPQNRNVFYYINQNNVNMYNTETKQVGSVFYDSSIGFLTSTQSKDGSCNERIDLFSYLDGCGLRVSGSRWSAQPTYGPSVEHKLVRLFWNNIIIVATKIDKTGLLKRQLAVQSTIVCAFLDTHERRISMGRARLVC